MALDSKNDYGHLPHKSMMHDMHGNNRLDGKRLEVMCTHSLEVKGRTSH